MCRFWLVLGLLLTNSFYTALQTPFAITANNIDYLTEVARLEQGSIDVPYWSSDGRWILAAGSLGLWRFDLMHSDRPPLLLEFYRQPFALSPDGKVASANEEGDIVSWRIDAPLSSELLYDAAPNIPVTALKFSPDGKVLALGYWSPGGGVIILDTATHQQIIHLHGDGLGGGVSQVETLAYSPNGQWLGVGTYGSLQIYETATWQPISVSSNSVITDLSFDANSQQIAYVYNGYRSPNFKLTDIQQKESLSLFLDTNRIPTAIQLAFSPVNTHILAVANGESVQLWDTATQFILEEWKNGSNVAFSPDGQQLAVVDSLMLILYDLKTLQITHQYGGFNNKIGDVMISDAEEWLAYERGGGTIGLWNIQNLQPEPALSVQMNWQDATHGFPIQSFIENQNESTPPETSPNALRLVPVLFNSPYEVMLNPDFSLNLIDTATHQILYTLIGHEYPLYIARFSPDNQLLVTADQTDLGNMPLDSNAKRSVRVWDVETGQELAILLETTINVGIQNLVFSPDGRYLAVVTWNMIDLWETHSWEKVISIAENISQYDKQTIFNYSSDLLIFKNYAGGLQIIETTTGRLIGEIDQGGVRQMLFTDNDRFLILICDDSTIRVWGIRYP